MKISLGLYPNQSPAEVIAAGKLADNLGFDTLWILDSHLLFREVYILLGALAVSTKNIRLGTAVTNPLTLHPTVTASAFSTLAALSGHRATLGISVGDSALRSMNLEIAKMATLEQAVSQIRNLLTGEKVSFSTESIAKLTFPERHVPIYIAATAPRMLQMSGRIGDGVILMNGVAPELIETAIAIVREGERVAGRNAGSTKIVVWAACHTDYQAVKYNVARAILRNIPGPIDELTRRVAAEVKESYNYDQHALAEAEFAHIIPDELVPRFAFSGTPAKIKSQIDALELVGVDEIVLAIPFASQFSSRDDVMNSLAPLIL